jgi:hypothetical protein
LVLATTDVLPPEKQKSYATPLFGVAKIAKVVVITLFYCNRSAVLGAF